MLMMVCGEWRESMRCEPLDDSVSRACLTRGSISGVVKK